MGDCFRMDKVAQNFDLINYICNNKALIIISCLIGVALGYFLKELLRKGLKRMVRKLDNMVLLFSLMGAIFCLFVNLFLGKENVSIQLLSFYTSFIFAWLLTKKSSKEEFENTQHKVAKNTFRHIEDVETAALVTRERLYVIKDKEDISEKDMEGILDNIEIILTGIRSNKEDWMEMLKPSYVKKLKSDEDPEARLLHSKEKKAKREGGKKESVNHPELGGLSEVLGDNVQADNNA